MFSTYHFNTYILNLTQIISTYHFLPFYLQFLFNFSLSFLLLKRVSVVPGLQALPWAKIMVSPSQSTYTTSRGNGWERVIDELRNDSSCDGSSIRPTELVITWHVHVLIHDSARTKSCIPRKLCHQTIRISGFQMTLYRWHHHSAALLQSEDVPAQCSTMRTSSVRGNHLVFPSLFTTPHISGALISGACDSVLDFTWPQGG